MHACLGSARHQFIAPECRSVPLVFIGKGLQPPQQLPLRGPQPEEELKVTNPHSAWAGYSDHPQTDVSQGLGAVSGLQSQGVPRAVIATVAG